MAIALADVCTCDVEENNIEKEGEINSCVFFLSRLFLTTFRIRLFPGVVTRSRCVRGSPTMVLWCRDGAVIGSGAAAMVSCNRRHSHDRSFVPLFFESEVSTGPEELQR